MQQHNIFKAQHKKNITCFHYILTNAKNHGQFNMSCLISSFCRSTVSLTHTSGRVLNSYSYDPFGNVLSSVESRKNIFLFVGQWGVVREIELTNIYRMRSRLYDSELGRFLSPDPLGRERVDWILAWKLRLHLIHSFL